MAATLATCQSLAGQHGLWVGSWVVAHDLTHHVVYRRLPDGRLCRLGRRSTVSSLWRWLLLLTRVTPAAARSAASSTAAAAAAPRSGNTGGHIKESQGGGF